MSDLWMAWPPPLTPIEELEQHLRLLEKAEALWAAAGGSATFNEWLAEYRS